jgi:hypothetical protein
MDNATMSKFTVYGTGDQPFSVDMAFLACPSLHQYLQHLQYLQFVQFLKYRQSLQYPQRLNDWWNLFDSGPQSRSHGAEFLGIAQ